MLTLSNKQRLHPLAAALLLALACSPAAQAHDGEHEEQAPTSPGLRLSAAAVLSGLRASSPLPSQGLPGFLMRGDPGVDLRGGQLEHGTLGLGYRFNEAWSAELAVGAHGRDPLHLEAAALRWQGQAQGWDLSLNLGRQSPAQGSVIGPAGHLDRFGLMPLAKQAQTEGDWLADGAQLSLFKRQAAGLVWRADLGLWTGRYVSGGMFPAGQDSPAAPSLHLGLQGEASHGAWTLDGFASPQRVRARGARFISSTGAHSHKAPVCDAALSQVVCFDGDSHLWGLSASWAGRQIPLSLSAALLWREESGDLLSSNGAGEYQGHNRGGWLQALWRFTPAWETGVRLESLSSTQTLTGPGAKLLALNAGFDRYAPLQRNAWMLGYQYNRALGLRVEAGQERAGSGGTAVSFAALRLVLAYP